jgi:hypothetical protein
MAYTHTHTHTHTVVNVNDCYSVVIVVRVETCTAIVKGHLWNVCMDAYCNISLCQKNSSRVQHRLAHIVHEV